jgi:hypothetical protein
MEMIDFQGKKWRVLDKVEGKRVEDPNSLKDNYGCDMVIKNNSHFFMLDEIKDAEYEDI